MNWLEVVSDYQVVHNDAYEHQHDHGLLYRLEKSMTRCSLVCERRGDDLPAAYFILLGGVGHILYFAGWDGMISIQAGWASTVDGSRPELLKIGLHVDETAVTMSLYTYIEHLSMKTSLLEPS